MPTVVCDRRALGVALTVVMFLVGCEMKPEVPPRLPGISPTAVWAGWVDGGTWVECWFDKEANANWCTAWNDQTGEVAARTHYVLRSNGAAVLDHDLKYVSFNGTDISLTGDRVLVPRRKTDDGMPLIEPARERPVK